LTPISTLLEQRLTDTAIGDLPAFIGVLASIQARAQLKLIHREPEPSRQEDRLLAVDEVSVKLGMTKDYLYRHADTFPFSIRLGSKQLRFSLNGIERYIKQRRSRLDITT